MTEAIRAITMPKWGLAMEEGMVVAWHVAEGGTISAGDELVDIETTKITNAFESPLSGTLRRRVVGEGTTVPVGALLAVAADASVPEGEIDAFIDRFSADFAVSGAEAEAAGPRPETVEANGRRINYLAAGDDDATPLVLVHGFGGDLNTWMFNQPFLAESRRVVAIDLPGHGSSSKDVGNGDVAFFKETVRLFLDALGIDRTHLVGHSLGGAIVLEVALQQPERTASLTLIASAGLGSEINDGYIQGFIRANRRKDMKDVLRDLYADPDQISRDLVNEVLKYKRLDGVEGALRTIAGAVFTGGRQAMVMADRVAGLAMPAQVIWGREDKIVPPSHAEGLPGNVPVYVIDNAGHMVHMEAAGEVNRLIAEHAA